MIEQYRSWQEFRIRIPKTFTQCDTDTVAGQSVCRVLSVRRAISVNSFKNRIDKYWGVGARGAVFRDTVNTGITFEFKYTGRLTPPDRRL